MKSSSTTSYETLRRTGTLIRVLAPLAAATLAMLGVTLFVGVAPKLLNPGYGVSERLIWGVVGLAYLMGLPFAGYVVFFFLRGLADMIELWINSTLAAEKTAQLMERQLVPGVLRMCQLLERLPQVAPEKRRRSS